MYARDPIGYWFMFADDVYAPAFFNAGQINFRDDSVGAVSWRWSFGSTVFSTAQNPSVTQLESAAYNSEIVFPNGTGSLEGVYLPVTLEINGVLSKTRNIAITPFLP
jgi:hypothetical protein